MMMKVEVSSGNNKTTKKPIIMMKKKKGMHPPSIMLEMIPTIITQQSG